MKPIKIIKEIEKEKEEIDWSVPMWVQHKQEKDFIVLTTGHTIGDNFEGTALPCTEYRNGEYCNEWAKKSFQKLSNPIQIEISN